MIRTQCEQIYRYLCRGNSLTAIEALHRFGCMRLASRVYDLNTNELVFGNSIKSDFIKLSNGKRVKQYFI